MTIQVELETQLQGEQFDSVLRRSLAGALLHNEPKAFELYVDLAWGKPCWMSKAEYDAIRVPLNTSEPCWKRGV